MPTNKIYRGEIWEIDFRPAKGHEQDEIRPGLIISDDQFNNNSELVFAIPISTKARYYKEKLWPTYVPVKPPDGGVKQASYIKCEHMRSLSHERLRKRWGIVDLTIIRAVEKRLLLLLSLQ